MHSAEDSAAIAVRILQRRERERPVEAAERRLARARSLGESAQGREENERLQTALADSRNEVASLREYTTALEARLNGLYAEQDMAALLRPRGIGRRLVRFIVVALLGAVGVLLLQMTTPMGARLTDSLRKRSLGGLAAEVSQAVRRLFHPSTSDAPPSPPTSYAPASPQPTPPPAPVVVKEPEPPLTHTTAPAPVVAAPRSESRRRAPSAPTRHAQPRKAVQGTEVQEAVIPACSDSDPLCGISKRPH